MTATPASGYGFVNWTQNGSVVSTSASYTFPLTGNTTLVANFVQQQGAARGQLEAAGSALHRACECTFFTAEDLAFDERLRNCRAVDRHKGPRLARAQIMQGARHQLLACTAFPRDEHGHDDAQSQRHFVADDLSRFAHGTEQ